MCVSLYNKCKTLISSRHMQLEMMMMSNSKLFLSFFLFFLFISFASSSYSSNNSHICSPEQSHALLLFKQKLFSTDHSVKHRYVYDICRDWLGSGYYPIMMNWKPSIDCCNWDGVTCNHFTGDVIDLDLSCGMLRGTIHSNSTLFDLPHLQRLNLAFNSFFPSQLSQEIVSFSTSITHLNISECGFKGQVPTNTTFLHKLVSIDLSHNYFDSRLEPRVLNNLLQNSTHLRHLSLGDVHIGLVLPAYLNITPPLKLLDLRSTGLQGKLPDNIFNLQYLEKLDLSGNNDLANRLPKVNTNTSIPLKWLSLSLTRLSSGEISDSIGHLKSLSYLDLSSSNLSGVILDSIGHLKSLDTLQLDSCDLMGPLPKFLVNLRHLTTLGLSSNHLNGTLPSWLFTLPSLEEIYLYGNMFSGSLPSELFALQSLKRLSLGYNQFGGVIDVLDHGPTLQTFQQLANLTFLDLAHNNFSGEWELDTLLSSLTVLVELDLSYSGLTVTTNNASRYVNLDFRDLNLASCKLKVFPDTLRAMRKLQSLDLSGNEISGRIPDWAGEIGGNELLNLNLAYNFITSLPPFQWDLHYFNLHTNLIEGPFPPSICNMSEIWYLDMSNNRFDGVIPKCLSNISSSLGLVGLGNNYFHGTIPRPHKGCGIQELLLNENQLEGEVPNSLSECGSLIELDLHSNKIQGPFPPSICNMSSLQYLRISDNRLGGVIPQCFENITSNIHLWMVDLGDNYFHGTIPNASKDCGSLEGLILKGNQLEGEVPSSLANCQFLKVFDLGNNHLNGTFPSWLGDLPLLQVLNLKSNNFYGPIRTSSTKKNQFPSLQVIDLSHNGFVGHLPGNYFQSFNVMKNVVKSSKKPTYLLMGGYYYSITVAVKGMQLNFPQILVEYTIIDLSNNRFEGEIPNVIGNLTSLIVLNLSHNKLTGQIPHTLGNLSEIESLDLSWNQLRGGIPQSLVDLRFLEFLNLSQNHLVGRIPQGKQFNTFEGSSFGGNPKLCGLPLPKKCEHPGEPQLEDDEETESGFTWRVVMWGYGCGTLLGLVMGYLMLSTGKPKWFHAIADAGEHMIQRRQKKSRYIVYIGK